MYCNDLMLKYEFDQNECRAVCCLLIMREPPPPSASRVVVYSSVSLEGVLWEKTTPDDVIRLSQLAIGSKTLSTAGSHCIQGLCNLKQQSVAVLFKEAIGCIVGNVGFSVNAILVNNTIYLRKAVSHRDPVSSSAGGLSAFCAIFLFSFMVA